MLKMWFHCYLTSSRISLLLFREEWILEIVQIKSAWRIGVFSSCQIYRMNLPRVSQKMSHLQNCHWLSKLGYSFIYLYPLQNFCKKSYEKDNVTKNPSLTVDFSWTSKQMWVYYEVFINQRWVNLENLLFTIIVMKDKLTPGCKSMQVQVILNMLHCMVLLATAAKSYENCRDPESITTNSNETLSFQKSGLLRSWMLFQKRALFWVVTSLSTFFSMQCY